MLGVPMQPSCRRRFLTWQVTRGNRLILGVPAFQRNCRARAQHRGARARNRIEATMTEYLFDHDRLDVYRLSIEYVANAFDTSR